MSETLNLDHLKPLYADAPQELLALVKDMLNDSAALIDAIERRAEEGDEKATDSAHELKGVCSTTGANELAEIAAEIETWGRAGDYDRIGGRIEELRAAHRRLVEAATALR